MENKLLETVQGLTTTQHFAVGNDLVHVPTFELSLTPEFKSKAYTELELAYCDQFAESLLRYASTWAAKEAVYKAIKQLSPATTGWKKIEITRDKIGGRPRVTLHNHPHDFKISLTISHDGDYVWAVAFVEPHPLSLD
ncbi:holo-ACP synthase [Mucilaginibacter limnophilus]|uniref:Holo-ACP synthase n=1 Tax=Mucilaginibacter limnophilus TaxID=1932778 RepID=A0A3S2V364_9SPHI|nr:holo-ACP synthase [Mucilaginibacter limnophilus]RVU02101.1 holo-ACP synthase [Mucilaginibacter limnophilus]